MKTLSERAVDGGNMIAKYMGDLFTRMTTMITLIIYGTRKGLEDIRRVYTEANKEGTDTQSTYRVSIYTGDEGISDVYVTLMDANNQSSDKILIIKPFILKPAFMEIAIPMKENHGDIVQVKLEESGSEWYCSHIEVKTPSGKSIMFPCYRWIDENNVIIREGRALLPQDDTKFENQRKEELESRKKIFRWAENRSGFPKCMDAKLKDLPLDVKFDKVKESDFDVNYFKALVEAGLDKLLGYIQSWKDIHDFQKIFRVIYTKGAALENVIQNWNTDYMFGYQFLNGCNPVMIRKCMILPEKFPVTDEMVKGSLQRGLTLQEEIEKGNIYIADYEILEGLSANKTPNTPFYLTAPICLLYNNKLNQIVPIAIQLSQWEKSPIFLPDDNEYDWMLAKMWVKSSDFSVHQLVTHLLKTHLISEVFEVAMYRQLSAVHPVYKLLIPHVRFTIAINAEAREKLISVDGVFSKTSSISGNGIDQLLGRATKTLTYKSLCFPETIKARGMEDALKYYYREDGMRIWKAIHCFVDDVIEIYYDSDEKVENDVEIQGFVKDVSIGLLDSNEFPQSLNTRAELTEYLTAVIFNASAQHAAVNFGQFDWYAWIPNSPSTMRKAPPEQKGVVDLQYIMDSLPDRDCSSVLLGTVWTLSRFQKNERYLGTYPDMHFTEPPVKEAIKKFCEKLDELTNSIKLRNEELKIAYGYLSPNKIPNSVAI